MQNLKVNEVQIPDVFRYFTSRLLFAFLGLLSASVALQLYFSNDYLTSHSKPSRIETVIARRQRDFQTLTSQFTVLLEQYLNSSMNSERTFIYLCDNKCFNDKFYKGAVTSFIIAILLNRRLVFLDLNTCSMADVLNFNAYYWQAPEDFHSSGKISMRSIIENTESLKIHDTQIFGLAQKISDGDLAKSYPNENLLLSETINFIGDLRRNAVAQAKTPWLLSMPESDIVRLLYTGLFKLPPLMYSKLMTSLKTQVRDRQLVCYFGDANTPHGQLLAFLRKLNITGDYMIYSNNEDLSKSLLPLEKMKVLSINITSDVPSVQRCAHANKKVIDIEISTMCDVLITSNNPTGILGATLRTTSTNLFCVNHEGTIYQCVRSELDSSFRDHFHKPLDIMYLKLRM